MNLSNLKPGEGSIHTSKKRIGRGQGSGKGGTATRGHKGAKSRSGYSKKLGFEGGQMPLYRRLPKRGFNPIKKNDVARLNIGKIQLLIDKKKIKVNEKINLGLLKKLKLVSGKFNKIKILGSGDLKDKIDIEANYVSKSLKEKLDKTGSAVKILK